MDFSDDGLKLAIENQDTFQLEGQVRIRIHGYGSKQIPVASDAYHKEKSIHFDRKVEALSCLTDVLSGEISAREVVNLTQQDQHPEKLICGSILPGIFQFIRSTGGSSSKDQSLSGSCLWMKTGGLLSLNQRFRCGEHLTHPLHQKLCRKPICSHAPLSRTSGSTQSTAGRLRSM